MQGLLSHPDIVIDDQSRLRQVVRITIVVCAVYGLAACLAPFISQLSLSIPSKVWLYRKMDFFPVIPVFLCGMLLVHRASQLRLAPVIILPLIWILVIHVRGPWLVPGTFDWDRRSFAPVLPLCAVAIGLGIAFQLISRRRFTFDSLTLTAWVPYALLAISILAVFLAESVTPLDSLVALSLPAVLGVIGVCGGILETAAPKLVGE